MKSRTFLAISIFALSACSNLDINTESDTTVDSSLQQHVHNFEEEAQKRGIDINVSELGITVELADIPESNVAGVCYYHSNAPGRIEIDVPFFQTMSDLDREYVVFHELGHCVLGRGHQEAQYANGVCRSIMASGTGVCFQRYNANTRTTFINELFANF